MTKPRATLYWHTTYSRESNNVIRSSKRQLIMKLVMSWCHTHTHTHTHIHAQTHRNQNSLARAPLKWQKLRKVELFESKTTQNELKQTNVCQQINSNSLSRPRWQTTKPSFQDRLWKKKKKITSDLWRRRFKLSRGLPLQRLVCCRATTTTTTTTDKGVNRASSKSRRRAVTGRDELSLTQRQ